MEREGNGNGGQERREGLGRKGVGREGGVDLEGGWEKSISRKVPDQKGVHPRCSSGF